MSSNPLTRGRLGKPACQILPAQIHSDHADLYVLMARKEEIQMQIASLDKRIAFEFSKLLQSSK
jgi:hypothetical protein